MLRNQSPYIDTKLYFGVNSQEFLLPFFLVIVSSIIAPILVTTNAGYLVNIASLELVAKQML